MLAYITSFLLDNVGSVVSLIIGVVLVIFRRQIVRLNLRHEYKHATAKQKSELRQAEDLGFKHILLRFQEIVFIVAGVIVIVISLQKLFFPSFGQSVRCMVGIIVFSLVSLCLTVVVLFASMRYLFWRKVNEYAKERYSEFYRRATSSSLSDQIESFKSRQRIVDPVLQRMRKTATIYTVIWFFALFTFFFFALYGLIRVTS